MVLFVAQNSLFTFCFILFINFLFIEGKCEIVNKVENLIHDPDQLSW